jgi:hypothetical protein
MKKIIVIASAIALVGAVAFVATGSDAFACNKSGKTAEAGYTKSSCSSKTAEAGYTKSSCSSKGATASAGCSGKSAVAGYEKAACSKSACAGACCSATAQASKQASDVREVTDELPYGNNKRLVLTGSIACGKCTYKTTASCAPLLKTADGKVYPLSPNNNLVNDMKHSKAGSFEVSARVKKSYGTKYLDVVAFHTL